MRADSTVYLNFTPYLIIPSRSFLCVPKSLMKFKSLSGDEHEWSDILLFLHGCNQDFRNSGAKFPNAIPYTFYIQTWRSKCCFNAFSLFSEIKFWWRESLSIESKYQPKCVINVCSYSSCIYSVSSIRYFRKLLKV